MATRGKRGYQRREFRNTNRRSNSNEHVTDLPSTSRQNYEEWDENPSNSSQQAFSNIEPGFSEHQAWLNELSATWNKNNDNYLISQLLKVTFKSSNNPYRTALYLMSESPDFKTGKPNTLSSIVMKVFGEWLNEEKSCENPQLTLELQADAIDAVSNQNNSNLSQIVAKIYKLEAVGEDFIDKVKCMVKFKEYKQACLFATLLKIQKYFHINEFLVPLLLQDRMNLVQNYLDDCPEHQKPFVQFLDGMCTYEKNAYQLVSALEIEEAKPGKWNPKAFKKLGSRLMRLYNISADVCSNISQINNMGTLKYLVYKKYIERSISDEAWEEMIDSVIKDDVGLQLELCAILVWNSDLQCAVKFVNKYDIPRHRIEHDCLLAALDDEIEESQNYVECELENWDFVGPEKEYYSLTLPYSAIIGIDDKHKFEWMMDVLQASNVIGCDCEWKPGTASKLSIIQLATRDQIFIIDVKVILENEHLQVDAKDWRAFILTVFANPEIRKIGFGFSTDLKMLSQSLPDCQKLHLETKNLLDLHGLCQKLSIIYPEIFPFESEETTRGLCDIVQMCCGKKLDKREQFSNWDNRPLRKQQIEYAALDAFCLLQVYDLLHSRAAELGIDLESLTSGPQGKKSKRKSPRKSEEEPQTSNIPTLRKPSDLKVVVDSMLQGLGRQLRLMGVDVKMVENASDHESVLRIGLNEKRVILTSGSPFKKISQYVTPDMCHYVNVSLSQREQALKVLHCYNVQVTQQDIFSRCPKCNNSRYIKVDSDVLLNLWKNSLVVSEPSPFRKGLWKAFDGGKIDTLNVRTDENASLQFDGVRDELFTRVKFFYVCGKCGKVYWEGSHLKRVVSSLKNVVNDRF